MPDNQSSIKNNQALYEQFITLAEEYAYQDINWSDFVLVDIWKNDKNRDRCKFTNGQEIEFSIGKQRFKSIRKAKIHRKTGSQIIAIRRGDKTIYSPSEDELIIAGDYLLAIGKGEQIRELYNLSEPEKSIENI